MNSSGESIQIARPIVTGFRKCVDETKEKYYSVRILNEQIYRAGLNALFRGIEAPNVIPKSAPFSIPMLGSNDEFFVPDIKNYLLSAQGPECELMSPFCVNCSPNDLGSGVIDCDAWDNQSDMSCHIEVNNVPCSLQSGRSIVTARSTGKNRNVSNLLNHLGDYSCVLDKSSVTQNTRYLLEILQDGRQKSTPYANNIVLESLNDRSPKGWLAFMPDNFVVNLYLALIAYRCAFKVIAAQSSKNRVKSGLGSYKIDNTMGDVCKCICDWGIDFNSQSSSKKKLLGGTNLFKSSLFLTRASGVRADILNVLKSKEEQESFIEIVEYINNSFRESPPTELHDPTTITYNSYIRVIEYRLSDRDDLFNYVIHVINGIRELKGTSVVDKDKSVFTNSCVCLLRKVSYGLDSKAILLPCLASGIPLNNIRTYRDLWSENFCYIRRNDPLISYDVSDPDSKRTVRLLSTPPYIWSEAIRFPIPNPGSSPMTWGPVDVIAQLKRVLQTEYKERYSRDYKVMQKYASKFSRCYLVWNDGLEIRFENSSVILKWGEDLRMSSLLTTRLTTVMQNYSDSYIITTPRVISKYSLNVFSAERFGTK